MPRKLRVRSENDGEHWIVAWGPHPLHGLVVENEQKAEEAVKALAEWAQTKGAGWLSNEADIVGVVLRAIK